LNHTASAPSAQDEQGFKSCHNFLQLDFRAADKLLRQVRNPFAERSSVVTETMQDVYPTLADAEQLVQPLRHDYLLYGLVQETTDVPPEFDGDLLNKLTLRRLKRLERVLAAHGGHLVKSMPRALVAGFHSAESALIGACEMQRRNTVIPSCPVRNFRSRSASTPPSSDI
jgi:hypothetical protein